MEIPDKKELTQEAVAEKLTHLAELGHQAELFLLSLFPEEGKKINFRRQILRHMTALSLNVAHSVVVLIEGNNIYTSGILARTLLEQWTNMQYIYLTPTYENLVRYLYDGDSVFIKNTSQLAELYREINDRGDFTDLIEDAEGGAQYRKLAINELKRYGYPLKKMPPYLDRVKLIDEYNNSMEMTTDYYYSYAYLSTNVHASKDKLIEMTRASTYDEWFQAIAEGDMPYRSAAILNIVGYTLELIIPFVAKKHRVKLTPELKEILKKAEYKILLSNYTLRSPID